MVCCFVLQCTEWVEHAKLNLMRDIGIEFAHIELYDGDVYFIPRNVVHQFQTVAACTSIAWHLRHKDYVDMPQIVRFDEHALPLSLASPKKAADSPQLAARAPRKRKRKIGKGSKPASPAACGDELVDTPHSSQQATVDAANGQPVKSATAAEESSTVESTLMQPCRGDEVLSPCTTSESKPVIKSKTQKQKRKQSDSSLSQALAQENGKKHECRPGPDSVPVPLPRNGSSSPSLPSVPPASQENGVQHNGQSVADNAPVTPPQQNGESLPIQRSGSSQAYQQRPTLFSNHELYSTEDSGDSD